MVKKITTPLTNGHPADRSGKNHNGTVARQTLPKTFAQKTSFHCSFIPKISPVFDDLP